MVLGRLALGPRELESSNSESTGKRKRRQHFMSYKGPMELFVRVAAEGLV